jgi:hypothetical protein
MATESTRTESQELAAAEAASTVPAPRQAAEAANVAASVVGASTRAAGAAFDALRHPGTTVDRAQHLLGTLPMVWSSAKPIMTGHCDNWREQYAYTLGVQAFVYGFPWLSLPALRWRWVTQQDDSIDEPYAALNEFWHMQHLPTPQHQSGGSPNTDTLRSVAWLDLRQGPVVLSHPDMGQRYFCFQLASMDSDTFAYVGTRSTGATAGAFAIVGPDWTGNLPDGVEPLAPSRTPYALVIGRTLLDGAEDPPNVHRLQSDYALTPLSRWHKKGRRARPNRDLWAPSDPERDPLAPWDTMNRAMTENPPDARHEALLTLYSTIGVGPGQDVHKLDEGSKRGLTRAAYEGQNLLDDVRIQGNGPRINGWHYPPPTVGWAGVHDDFVTRAAIQCAADTLVHTPEEAVYLTCSTDDKGQPLDGAYRYELRFAKDEIPKVHKAGFWSVTMYDADHNLADNAINRYSIGDRTPDLHREPDGGLTLYIQKRKPRGNRAANWLPSPAGHFSLTMRTYLPIQNIIEQRWQPPALTRTL